jgi:hypothetical protein
MKKLVFLVLIALAGWYGYKHYPGLLQHQPQNEIVVKNQAQGALSRLRVTVAGQTFVKESVEPGGSTTFKFRADHDSDFKLVWMWGDRPGEMSWSGGTVAAGPAVARHTFEIDNDGGVAYVPEPITSDGK